MRNGATGFSKLAALLAVLAIGLPLAACGGSDDDGGGDSGGGGETSDLPATIPVTFVAGTTGVVAYVANEELRGMRLALKEIDSSGMLGDSKIDLTVRDTAGDQGTATTQMSEAANSDAVAIFGPLLSNLALASAPIAQREEVPYIATQSQNPGLLTPDNNYVYRLTTSQLKYDNLIANYVAEKGIETVKLVYADDNPTLVEVSTKFLPASFEELGIEIQDNIGIPTATTDFSSLVTDLMEGNPDAIGLMLVGSAFPSLITALRDAGYEGELFGDSAATAGTLEPAGEDANGFFYAVDYNQYLDYASSRKFTEAYKEEYPDRVPYGYAASGYDAMMFFARAIEAGGATREGVLAGMEEIAGGGFDGATGPITFVEPDDRDISVPGSLVEWQSGKGELLVTAGDPEETIQPVIPPAEFEVPSKPIGG